MDEHLRYIFSINSGRCGSDYLTSLLGCATNAYSIHEGFPIMNGIPMIDFNQGYSEKLENLISIKLKEIDKAVKNKNLIYCETNHSFIKGWGHLIPDTHIPQSQIGIIILNRDIEDTIYSMLRVRQVPGTSLSARTWNIYPRLKSNLLSCPENSTAYDICKWYVSEISQRASEYKSKYPRIKYFECNLSQLNSLDFVAELFDHFGLVADNEKLKNIFGNTINTKNEWPKYPREYFTKLSKYKHSNNLEHEKQISLCKKIVDYLINQNSLPKFTRDMSFGGSIALSVTKFIALKEGEIEDEFGIDLRFSELEMFLIYELTYAVNPSDFLFVFVHRFTEPKLNYQIDLNIVPSFGKVYSELGIRGILNLAKVVLGGYWGRDYSHRK